MTWKPGDKWPDRPLDANEVKAAGDWHEARTQIKAKATPEAIAASRDRGLELWPKYSVTATTPEWVAPNWTFMGRPIDPDGIYQAAAVSTMPDVCASCGKPAHSACFPVTARWGPSEIESAWPVIEALYRDTLDN